MRNGSDAHLVHGSGEPLGVGVEEPLIVVGRNPRVVVVRVERLEILRVVRQQDDTVLDAPGEEVRVSRVFAEPVFRLLDVESPLAEQTLEHATDVFVEEETVARHLTGSFGFSEDPRTRSNASSFARSNSRIDSMLA